MGYPVGVFRALSISPILKRRAIMNAKPRVALIIIVCIKILGIVIGALRTSSLKWIDPSNPARKTIEYLIFRF